MGLGPAYGDGFVGISNFTDDSNVYLKGNESTDGSKRFTLDAATGLTIRAECRIAGVWVLSDLLANIDPASVDGWIVDDVLGEFVLDIASQPVEEG